MRCDGILWIRRLTQSVAESSLSPSMLDKQEFYHGAAIVRLLEDHRYRNLRRQEYYYLVNDRVLVFLKYSTKSRSPWRFNFTEAEFARLNEASSSGGRVVVALVCGGDGVCSLTWRSVEQLLGKAAGRISARRKFNESYGVSGPNGEFQRKVQLQQWPKIVFEDETELTPVGSEGGVR